MEEKWRCETCGAEFPRPAVRWEYDDGATATATHVCPLCASRRLTACKPCPTCDGGWRDADEPVCLKCHLRNLAALGRFARQFTAPALADMDAMLEGNALILFQ